MNLPELTENVNIHQSLPDQPTLTPTELKIKWDEGVAKIKEYINNVLLPAIENGITSELESERQSLLNSVRELLDDLESELRTEINSVKSSATSQVSALESSMNSKISSINNSISSINSQITNINSKLGTVANASTALVTMGNNMSRTYELTYKQGNVVHSRVEINTTIGGNQTVTLFTLPVGYRPTGFRRSTVLWANNDFDGRYDATIQTNGQVQITVGQVPPTSITVDINFVI